MNKEAIRLAVALARLQDALHAVKEASRRLEELDAQSPLSVELLDALDEARDKCRQERRSIECMFWEGDAPKAC